MANGDAIYLRGKTWWLDFRHEGQRHVRRLGRNITKGGARDLARAKRTEILKGEAGMGHKRKNALFDKAAAEFLAWAKANRRAKTVQSYRGCVRELLKSFGGKRLSEIHPFLIEKHKQRRLAAGAKVAVNRELACLKALFNRMIDWRKFQGVNPVRSVKMLRESKGRVRYLDGDEERRLLEALDEPLRTVVVIGVHAGLRIQSEALTLRKEYADLKQGLLTVQAAYAKSGEMRMVPLNSVLREALKRVMEKGDSEYVFSKVNGSPYRSIRTAFETACRRAGLSGLSPHVLRHTFASRLAMAGVDLRTIQELGGWKTLKMVERYSHLSPSHKQEAVEKIAEFTTLFTTPANTALPSLPQSIVK